MLKPCPFCGGEATLEEVDGVSGTRKSVGCSTEFCYGFQSFATFTTHKEAKDWWNKRDCLTDAIKALNKLSEAMGHPALEFGNGKTHEDALVELAIRRMQEGEE